jgi:acylphosphatase
MIRRHIFFKGHVQGVGFRFTTRQTASRYDVTGFVRNLPDGRVEVVVEGADDEVEAFYQDLAGRMKQYIHDTDIASETVTGEFEGFRVVY